MQHLPLVSQLKVTPQTPHGVVSDSALLPNRDRTNLTVFGPRDAVLVLFLPLFAFLLSTNLRTRWAAWLACLNVHLTLLLLFFETNLALFLFIFSFVFFSPLGGTFVVSSSFHLYGDDVIISACCTLRLFLEGLVTSTAVDSHSMSRKETLADIFDSPLHLFQLPNASKTFRLVVSWHLDK